MLRSTEADNRMVWDRQRPGHYEVWYLTFNHRPSQTGFWIRYTLEAPTSGPAYCQLWFACCDAHKPKHNVALNRRLPISQLGVDDEPFAVRIGDAELRHGTLRGSLASRTHAVSWDLSFVPAGFTHHHLPGVTYRKDFADTKVLSPNLMTHFSGNVVVDGRTYALQSDPGCQSHVWGRKHAHAWAWCHCNAFREDSTAAIEGLSVRLRRHGLVTPTLTMLSLYLGSEVHHFNEFWMMPLTRGRWETGLYSFAATGKRMRIEGEMRCRPEDLVRAQYADPDGEAAFCHNTTVADCSLTLWQRRSPFARFRQYQRLTSRAAAHFEYAGRSPDGRVDAQHLEVDS